MGAHRYGFFSRVHLTIELQISNLTREEKVHIYKQPCIILLINHINDDFLNDFSEISEHFPNSRRFPKLSEGQTTVSEHTREFPKISEKEPMFRSYRNTSEYFLRDYVATAMAHLLGNHSNGSLLKTYFHM